MCASLIEVDPAHRCAHAGYACFAAEVNLATIRSALRAVRMAEVRQQRSHSCDALW
jgi:hypothetical protein